MFLVDASLAAIRVYQSGAYRSSEPRRLMGYHATLHEDTKHMLTRSVSRKLRSWALLFAACIALHHPLLAQPSTVEKVIERMEKEGCVPLQSGVKVCRYDYAVNGK